MCIEICPMGDGHYFFMMRGVNVSNIPLVGRSPYRIVAVRIQLQRIH
jgi:hypothetical protein